MAKLLAVLIDGLNYRFVTEDRLPFVSTLQQRRIKTILGFSIACHATILTGVYPETHLHWFHLGYSPQTSPFRGAQYIPNWLVQSTPYIAKKAVFKLFGRLVGNRSVFGIPYPNRLHTRFWPVLDAMEHSLPHEPDAYRYVPSVFDMLTAQSVPWHALGMVRTASARALGMSGVDLVYKQLEKTPVEDAQFMYVLFGDIDFLSHFYGQDSDAVRDRLQKIDRLTADIHKRMGPETELLMFSDHGHVQLGDYVDIYQYMGDVLTNTMHLVDDMYLRVWEQDPGRRAQIIDRIGQVPHLKVLSDKEMRSYHVKMPDNRYGDVIAVLDTGIGFRRTTWTNQETKYVSMHGFRPEYDPCYGFVGSSFDLQSRTEDIELVELLPNILHQLGVVGE